MPLFKPQLVVSSCIIQVMLPCYKQIVLAPVASDCAPARQLRMTKCSGLPCQWEQLCWWLCWFDASFIWLMVVRELWISYQLWVDYLYNRQVLWLIELGFYRLFDLSSLLGLGRREGSCLTWIEAPSVGSKRQNVSVEFGFWSACFAYWRPLELLRNLRSHQTISFVRKTLKSQLDWPQAALWLPPFLRICLSVQEFQLIG